MMKLTALLLLSVPAFGTLSVKMKFIIGGLLLATAHAGLVYERASEVALSGNSVSMEGTSVISGNVARSIAMFLKTDSATPSEWNAFECGTPGGSHGQTFAAGRWYGYAGTSVNGLTCHTWGGCYQNPVGKSTDSLAKDTEWHHLAHVWDGSTHYLYWDGSLFSSGIDTNTQLSTAATGCVLGTKDNRFPFYGSIKNVYAYDEALNAGQIANLAANPIEQLAVNVAGSAFIGNTAHVAGPVSRCFDNTFGSNNFCHTQSYAPDNPWLRVDLGSAHSVANFKITNRADCCQYRLGAFEVYVGDESSDPTSNSMCYSGTAAADAAVVEEACAGHGRYLFVRLPGAGRIINLSEVQVYGGPATASPTGAPTGAPSHSSIVAKLETNGLQAGLGYVFGYTGDNAYMCSSTAGTTLCFKSAAADRDSWTLVAHDSAEVLAATDEETGVTMTDGVWEVTPGGPTFSSADGTSSSHYAAQCDCA